MPTPKGCPGYWLFVPPLLDLSIWRTVVKIHPPPITGFYQWQCLASIQSTGGQKTYSYDLNPYLWMDIQSSQLLYYCRRKSSSDATFVDVFEMRESFSAPPLSFMIIYFTRSCSFYMRRMRAIRRSVTSAVFATIVNALTCSRIDECTCTCNTLLMDIPKQAYHLSSSISINCCCEAHSTLDSVYSCLDPYD